MTVADFDRWDDFKEIVGRMAAEGRSDGWRVAFRGHSDATWPIQTTLDRDRNFASTPERIRHEDQLLDAFRREVLTYVEPGRDVPEGRALALLARHHGLPSSWTDWSTSPYVAAYFAFSTVRPFTDRVAIWAMQRDRLPRTFASEDLIDDPMALRFNTRAIRQRGVFIRVAEANAPLDSLIGDALFKITLPATVGTTAMAELLLMTINASTLFDDLNGAARAAVDRINFGF